MLGAALEALEEADVVLLVADTTRAPTKRDAETPAHGTGGLFRAPLFVALNKTDVAPEEGESGPGNRGCKTTWTVRPTMTRISALDGAGTDVLLDHLRGASLPEGPFLYPEDDIATESVRFFVAEMVRETIFEQFRQEIPYSVFCQVEEFRESQDPDLHTDRDLRGAEVPEGDGDRSEGAGRSGRSVRPRGRRSRPFSVGACTSTSG